MDDPGVRERKHPLAKVRQLIPQRADDPPLETRVHDDRTAALERLEQSLRDRAARIRRLVVEISAVLEPAVAPKHVIRPLERDLLEGTRAGEDRKRRVARLEIEEMDRPAESVQRALQLGVGVNPACDHRRADAAVKVGQAIEILRDLADVLDRGRAQRVDELGMQTGQVADRVLRTPIVAVGVEGANVRALALRSHRYRRRLLEPERNPHGLELPDDPRTEVARLIGEIAQDKELIQVVGTAWVDVLT